MYNVPSPIDLVHYVIHGFFYRKQQHLFMYYVFIHTFNDDMSKF